MRLSGLGGNREVSWVGKMLFYGFTEIKQHVVDLQTKHACWRSLTKEQAKEKLAWHLWRRLSEPQRQNYIHLAARSRSVGVRDMCSGKFMSVEVDVDNLLLEDLIVPAPKTKPVVKMAQKHLAAVGQAFLQVLAEDGTTKSQCSGMTHDGLLRRLSTKIVHASNLPKRPMRKVKKTIKKHYAPRLKDLPQIRGRKKGFRFISDEELRDLMIDATTECCKWSSRWNDHTRSFQGTKYQVWAGAGIIAWRISYRTFLRHLRLGRLGVGTGRKRTDKCDYCMKWDFKIAKEIEAKYKDIMASLKSICPRYFEKFMAGEKPVTCRAESPVYAQKLCGYIRSHEVFGFCACPNPAVGNPK